MGAAIVRRVGILGVGLAVLLLGSAAAQQSAPVPQAGEDQETEIGREVFNELKAKGEIIESSPLYDVLLPIIEPIMKAAQPRYKHPFKVYIVHEKQPNAFATPGGNIYVVDSLLYFAKNKEQLAGTLAHEVSHVIHEDSMNLLKKQKKIEREEVGAAILLGPTRAHLLALLILGDLRRLGYSREAEAQADLTGSDICAEAGTNPWGLVWLFQDFHNARTTEIPQILSDHPGDQARVQALEDHFKKNPQVFGRFDRNAASATPLVVPKNAPAVFMR